MQRPGINDLPQDQQQSRLTPSYSLGFARSQEFRPATEDGAARAIIDALGTHNVIGRTFSDFVDTEARPILNANPNRVGLTIQNVSGADVWVGIGVQPSMVGSTVLNGILIQNGGFYEPQNNYIATNDIFILGNGTGLQVNVIELTKII
jgi:hypothetical protein